MKLLWLSLFGWLGAWVIVRADERDYVVLGDLTGNPEAINLGLVEKYERSRRESDRPDSYVSRMQKTDNASMIARDIRRRVNDLPISYQKTMEKGIPMFRNYRAFNPDTGNDTSGSVILPPPQYRCRHRNILLRWFPHRIGRTLYFCFIPWASRQRIIYVRCLNKFCQNAYERACCRPACIQRRVIVALCVRKGSNFWRWIILNRYLPRACVCSDRRVYRPIRG